MDLFNADRVPPECFLIHTSDYHAISHPVLSAPECRMLITAVMAFGDSSTVLVKLGVVMRTGMFMFSSQVSAVFETHLSN